MWQATAEQAGGRRQRVGGVQWLQPGCRAQSCPHRQPFANLQACPLAKLRQLSCLPVARPLPVGSTTIPPVPRSMMYRASEGSSSWNSALPALQQSRQAKCS